MTINPVASFLRETQPKIDGTCGVPITSFRCSIPDSLTPLMSHTIIATKDVVDRIGNYAIATPDQEQINALIDALNKIYNLPSGALLLDKLNGLLADKGQKLVFSFVLDKQASPICKKLYITICDKDGTTERPLCLSFIRLPEQLPFAIKLPFFSKEQQRVIDIDEPIHIVIAHELIHCTQNLFYENVSADILAELRNDYPSIECLKAKNPKLLEWCKNFFGGRNSATWSDELQTMILGFRIGAICVSESQLLSELLKEGVCPHELADYRNDVLIPFGHSAPGGEPQGEDLLNFKILLFQIQTSLPLYKDILSRKGQWEIKLLLDSQEFSRSASCNIQ